MGDRKPTLSQKKSNENLLDRNGYRLKDISVLEFDIRDD